MHKSMFFFGLARCHAPARCESCADPAKFCFSYNRGDEREELALCDYHLADLLSSDSTLLTMLVVKLHEMLDPICSPLLFP